MTGPKIYRDAKAKAPKPDFEELPPLGAPQPLPNDPPKPKANAGNYHGPRRLRARSTGLLTKQAVTVLSREIDRLLDHSALMSLDKDDTNKLINYLKLLNDIRKIEARTQDPDAQVDAMLKKIAESESD